MNKRFLLTTLALGILTVVLIPESVEAVHQASDKFGGREINAHADDLMKFLFGPVCKIAGALGAIYGVILSVAKSSIQPLLLFGTIGLAVVILPTFIEKVFTVLLP